jgi:hypothetical protein
MEKTLIVVGISPEDYMEETKDLIQSEKNKLTKLGKHLEKVIGGAKTKVLFPFEHQAVITENILYGYFPECETEPTTKLIFFKETYKKNSVQFPVSGKYPFFQTLLFT